MELAISSSDLGVQDIYGVNTALDKMIIPGVAEWPSQGRLLGDVIGWHINLRKGAQCSFYSLKWMNFTLPSDPPLLKLEYLKIHCL